MEQDLSVTMSKPSFELLFSLLFGKKGDVSQFPRRESINRPLLPQNLLSVDASILRAVLRSLAAICVDREHGQVLSVTLTILADDQNSQQVTLHVAENNVVPESLVKHLHDVWEFLRDLKATGDDTNTVLGVAIYRYSYVKVRQRFKKRAPEFFGHFQRFVNRDIDTHTKDKALFRKLQNQLGRLRTIMKPRSLDVASALLVFSILRDLRNTWKPYLDDQKPDSLLTSWEERASQYIMSCILILLLIYRLSQRIISLYDVISRNCLLCTDTISTFVRSLVDDNWHHYSITNL
jgi:hypothetical protein